MLPRDPADPADRDEPGVDDEHDLRALRVALGRDDRDGADAATGAYGLDADTLGRLGGVAASLTPEDRELDEPPPGVWEGIAARTSGRAAAPAEGHDTGPGGAGTAPGAAGADQPLAPPGAPADLPPLRPIEGGRPADAPGRGPSARFAGRSWGLVAAAAAVVVVLVVGGVALLRGDVDSPPVVASAVLEPLPDEPTGSAGAVTADLVDVDGALQLDLSTAALPEPAGFYEVWLIDSDVEGMVSLGPARADGVYAVPADVDPGEFPIVDVSLEPADGDPTHSGVSVLRGTFA